MTSAHDHALQNAWAGAAEDTAALAAFVAHVEPSCISHGAVLCGRATSPYA